MKKTWTSPAVEALDLQDTSTFLGWFFPPPPKPTNNKKPKQPAAICGFDWVWTTTGCTGKWVPVENNEHCGS